MDNTLYQQTAQTITGEEISLSNYQGKVLLIVNTASKCGLTPQFEGLEKLYQKYNPQGLEILGFPCNQFANQDPGNEQEIASFCQKNYGVSFPMFAKVDVNGKNTHPLFSHLKSQAKGIAGSQSIKWNFTKFLVNRDGEVLKRFAPKDTPEKIAAEISKLL